MGTWSLLSKGIRCETSPVASGLCVVETRETRVRQSTGIRRTQARLWPHEKPPHSSHQSTVTWSWCSVTLREELMGRISASSRFPPETTTRTVSSWYSLQCPNPSHYTTSGGPPRLTADSELRFPEHSRGRGPVHLLPPSFFPGPDTAQIQVFARNPAPMRLVVYLLLYLPVYPEEPGPDHVADSTKQNGPSLPGTPATPKHSQISRKPADRHLRAPTALSLYVVSRFCWASVDAWLVRRCLARQ